MFLGILTCTWSSEIKFKSFFRWYPLWFLRQFLSLVWYSLSHLGFWPVSLRDLPVTISPRTGITMLHYLVCRVDSAIKFIFLHFTEPFPQPHKTICNEIEWMVCLNVSCSRLNVLILEKRFSIILYWEMVPISFPYIFSNFSKNYIGIYCSLCKMCMKWNCQKS